MLDIFTIEAGIALVTLTVLEIILGIDNILVLSIMTDRLPKSQQAAGRFVGLTLAALMRIIMLFFINAITKLTAPWFTVMGHEFAGRDLILIGGGLFLFAKAVTEIHKEVEGGEHEEKRQTIVASFFWVMVQVSLLDLVFSLDSVITAVGMAKDLWVMITAIVLSIAVMMAFAGSIAKFIGDHPTLKVLALSFLLLIGLTLTVDGLHLMGLDEEGHVKHFPKGYLYFAMGFSLFVEMLNLRRLAKRKTLRQADDATPTTN